MSARETGAVERGSRKGPLRKITKVLRFSDDPFAPAKVLLECGHTARSSGTYQARCKRCAETRPQPTPAGEIVERVRGLLESATPELFAAKPHRIAQMLRDGAHAQVPKADNIGQVDFDADASLILEAVNALPALLALIEQQAATIAELRGGLQEIEALEPRPFDGYPDDWQEQIESCPDCQSYKGHPIQQGICDHHRQPIYRSRAHDAHEEKAIGYRAKLIARATLERRGQ